MMFHYFVILTSLFLFYCCSLVLALASSSNNNNGDTTTTTTSSSRPTNDIIMSSMNVLHRQTHRRQQQRRKIRLQIPTRELAPPFPNGRCGGTIVTIPPEDTYGKMFDVDLANNVGVGDLILPPRPIQVWLPPGYNNDNDNNNGNMQEQRHPVLYVHDGQNCYEDTESWTGASWRLIGALTRLADHRLILSSNNNNDDNTNLLLPIVVMIPSADGDLLPGIRRRHLEYGDTNVPFAQLHVDFVAKTIKPLIDTKFITNPNPSHTFTIGSSLGGQASLHLLLRHPTLFGGAACLSPAFGPSIINDVHQAKLSGILKSKKIYLDIGGDFNNIKVPFFDMFDHITPEHWWNPGYFWLDTQLQVGVDTMKTILYSIDDVNCCYNQYPGGRHNERAWAQRIDKPLKYLFS